MQRFLSGKLQLCALQSDIVAFNIRSMPANIAREFNEKGTAYAREAYGKTQAAAGEATKVMEQTYSAASKGLADFNLHLLEIAQTNVNATFELARQLTQVKSPTEFFELSAAHMRKQVETLTEQTQNVTTLAQKLATEATHPLQAGVTKAFDRS
jgi:phasin